MSSSDPVGRLGDILEQIARIEEYVEDMTQEEFRLNKMNQDAVERCLERCCEAARKIGDLLDAKYPEVDFPGLRKFGSVLRHDYSGIDIDIVWEFLESHLPLLKAACRAELGL